ncbi:MAG: hypothetical protein DRQ37_05390 [Gammaproteobacteria bacterium]|nr:MAG: hypothetical protein DRQ37_05390 [Gammaproteobacteria bacterium]
MVNHTMGQAKLVAPAYRLAAATLDVMVLAVIVGPLVAVMSVSPAFSWPDRDLLPDWRLLVGLSSLGAGSAMALLWSTLHGTPGQLLLGHQVLTTDSGQRLSFARGLFRALAVAVTLLPFGVGFFWVLWDAKRQPLYDLIAGTMVVVEEESHRSVHELLESQG